MSGDHNRYQKPDKPVAYMHIPHDDMLETVFTPHQFKHKIYKSIIPVYTAPPRREWQGLTDEEVFAALVAVDGNTKRLAPGFVAFYCVIEAKLKEKNG